MKIVVVADADVAVAVAVIVVVVVVIFSHYYVQPLPTRNHPFRSREGLVFYKP